MTVPRMTARLLVPLAAVACAVAGCVIAIALLNAYDEE